MAKTCLVAWNAARLLTKMIAPALLPAERRDYFQKAYGICRRLLEARKRTRGVFIVPSNN